MPSGNESAFDAFAVLVAVQLLAGFEAWYRRRESIWWFSLLAPAAGAHGAWSTVQGTGLPGMLSGGGGGGRKEEEVGQALAAKRERRKALKEKRAGGAVQRK